MDRTFLIERITVTKAMIVAYEGALLALAAGNGVQSYTLDTGQNKQTVTRADIKSLQATLDGLYNRLTTLGARLSGGALISRPGW